MLDNYNLARHIAHRYRQKCDVPYEDLEQLALVGLIYASRVFEPERGLQFSTCAYPYIRGRIQHYLRDHSHLVTFEFRWREKLPEAKRLLNEENLPPDQVAQRIGMSLEDLNDMMSAMVKHANIDPIEIESQEPDIEERDHITGLFSVVEEAFANLPLADQALLERWWEKPRTRALPQQVLAAYHGRVQRLLRGVRLAEFRQLHLADAAAGAGVVLSARAKRRERLRRRKVHEVAAAAVQLGLLPPDCLALAQ